MDRVNVGTQSVKNTAEEAALLFDTKVPFEKWLQSLQKKSGEAFSVKETNRASDAFDGQSYAGANCEVTFSGLLRVDRTMKGNIRSDDGTLVMTEQGRIKADVQVRIALINGCLEGNLRASDYVILDRNARVAGNIHTPSLTVRDGAVFEGRSFLTERRDGGAEDCGAVPDASLEAMAIGA